MRRGTRQVDLGLNLGKNDDVLHGREFIQDRARDLASVECFAAIDVAIHGDECLRLDLAETIHNRKPPHIGRAQRPDRAYACDG